MVLLCNIFLWFYYNSFALAASSTKNTQFMLSFPPFLSLSPFLWHSLFTHPICSLLAFLFPLLLSQPACSRLTIHPMYNSIQWGWPIILLDAFQRRDAGSLSNGGWFTSFFAEWSQRQESFSYGTTNGQKSRNVNTGKKKQVLSKTEGQQMATHIKCQ